MAGYPIEALKKAETVTGLDIIPLQQNGITKQLERSIFDQAVIIEEAGSQSSGIIRKEGVFVLKNETQINFTLEAAAGRIVEDNEYKDSAEAASGWIVYVVNTSGIQHTVIHDANSWPINAGETLCFYWTGSCFTLHNIVINNLTVRGDTKLLEVPAVQTLVAENKLAVIGADGKIISTTVNDIVELANVDGKIDAKLADYITGKNLTSGTDVNTLVNAGVYTAYLTFIARSLINVPSVISIDATEVVINVLGTTSYPIQLIYANVKNEYRTWIRILNIKNTWEEITTTTALNNALTNYHNPTSKQITPSTNVNVQSGGYWQVGKMVVINIKASITSGANTNVKIGNFPEPKKDVGTQSYIAVSVQDITTDIPAMLYGYLNMVGDLYIKVPEINRGYAISCTYIAN